MEKTVAVIIELSVSVCALWLLFLLSTLFHELGHAVGYMLATGDRQWHIRVGWGKRILNTKRLTVNLLVFDGLFSPSKREFDSKAKLIMTLLGGPVFSLVLVAGLLGLRCSGPVLQSDFFADSAMEFFLNTALSVNLFILVLSIVPIRYFHGEIRGLETDGLQILHTIRQHEDEFPPV